jgi:hypothetical protein
MPEELIAGIDYYVENGRGVFTAQDLRRRGDRCQSGCRHCPSGFKKPPQPPEEHRGEEAR